ncbi:MAG: acyl--CoA ligase, partial [Clostridiales bacterium]|nr:acyl--CoA ligase [Clostridiales bacterium]
MERYRIKEVERDGRKIRAFDMPHGNLYETLAATAQRLPDKTGVVDDVRCLTFRQLREEADALAAYLRESVGVGPGDAVGILMVNSAAFCAAFYALMKLGAVAIPMSTKLQGEELLYRMNDCRMERLFCDAKWYGKVRQVLGRTGIETVIAYGDGTPDGCFCYDRCVDGGRSLAQAECAGDDALPAVIMYTSGTTGGPKGAVMTQFNLLQGMYAYAANDMNEDDRTVLAVPAFHITGLNCVMTVFVLLGGLQVMVPIFDAVKVLDRMTEYRVTHFHAVSTVYIKLEEGFIAGRHDLSALRAALCGGGFITRENIRKFCRIAPDARFHPVYGMTETSGAGTYFPTHCLDSERADSAGVCAPNCEMRIRSDGGEDGEICFRGAFVIGRYLHGGQNDNITSDGWLHSGDVGCFDADGYLYIRDRIKDMINRGGEKVFSYEVESAMTTFAGVRQAVVFAVDDAVYGEIPAAVYLSESNARVDEAGLIAHLCAKLAHFKVPVYLEHREQLPQTENGKIRKSELRKEFN